MRKAVIVSSLSGELQPVNGWQIHRVTQQEIEGRLSFRPSVFVLRLDNGVNAEELIAHVRNKHPRAGILATGKDVSAEKAVRAIQLGAHDYIEFNKLAPENLPDILDCVAGMAQRVPERADGKIVSLVGPTGAGVTTVSLNLAVALSSPGTCVLLLSPESDIPAYLYRLRFSYTVADFVADVGSSDPADIREQITRYMPKGRKRGEIHLLTGAPIDNGEPDERRCPLADADKIAQMETVVRSQFRYVIVDHGFTPDDRLLSCSDAILVVTDTMPHNVRKARIRAERLPEDPDKQLLVNKSTLMGDIRAEDVAQQLRFNSFHALPFDAVRTAKAAAAGEPLLARSSFSRLAWSFRRLAKTVAKRLQAIREMSVEGRAGHPASRN
jgi:MinD-like ATPase involved in chromosome partitioning or flagellar assembly